MGDVILAVGAHPDDIELGCGGTLKKHILNGDKVYGLVLTKGERGDHPIQEHECRNSAQYLGFEDIFMLDFGDSAITNDFRVVTRVEEFIKRLKPKIVYTHSDKDRHQDHRTCSLITKSAARYVPALFLFESPSSTIDFSPHRFSNITNTIKNKVAALSKYKSQVKRGSISPEWAKVQAAYWGGKNKTEKQERLYAEAFEINHMLV